MIVQSQKSKRKLISRYCHLIYNTLNKHHPSIKMLNNVFLPIATPTIYGHHHCCCYWNPPEECNDDYSHCFHHTQHQLFHHRKAAFELPYSFWSIKSFCLQPSNNSPSSGQGQMLETSFLSFCSWLCRKYHQWATRSYCSKESLAQQKEKDLTESTSVVSAEYPPKVKSELFTTLEC